MSVTDLTLTRKIILLNGLSFALMFLLPLLPTQLAVIIISTIGFDLSVQATLVAYQTLIYDLAPEAHSRLNALLFTVVFIGMASGGAFWLEWRNHAGGALSLGLRLISRHLHH